MACPQATVATQSGDIEHRPLSPYVVYERSNTLAKSVVDRNKW